MFSLFKKARVPHKTYSFWEDTEISRGVKPYPRLDASTDAVLRQLHLELQHLWPLFPTAPYVQFVNHRLPFFSFFRTISPHGLNENRIHAAYEAHIKPLISQLPLGHFWISQHLLVYLSQESSFQCRWIINSNPQPAPPLELQPTLQALQELGDQWSGDLLWIQTGQNSVKGLSAHERLRRHLHEIPPIAGMFGDDMHFFAMKTKNHLLLLHAHDGIKQRLWYTQWVLPYKDALCP